MGTLPLFSASFMPKDGGSFASSSGDVVVPPTAEVDGEPACDSNRALLHAVGHAFDHAHEDSHLHAHDHAHRPASDSVPGHPHDPAHEPTLVAPSHPIPGEGPKDAALERTETVLREAGLSGRFWRGDALSTSPLPSIPSGFRALDEQLPNGGWPTRCLTELMLAHVGSGEIRFLAATLASLTHEGREIVLLAPPHIPDPAGWEQLGIDMRRVLVVRAARPADRLWAIEESLRSSAFGALLAWLPEEKSLARHDALRRLQSAASSANGLTFLFRPAAAQYHASPAPLRLALAVGDPAGHRRTLSVRLLKRRGPVLARPLTLLLPEVRQSLRPFQPSGTDRRSPLPSQPVASHPGPVIAPSSARRSTVATLA